MNRRNFIKLLGMTGLSFLFPKIETENEMELGKILLKSARNEVLTPMEEQFLEGIGNQTQLINSFVSGNITSDGKFSIKLPFDIIFSEVTNKDITSLSIPIPQRYNHLLILASGRTDYVGDGTLDTDFIAMRFNGDSSNSYQYSYIYNFNDGSPSVETSYGDTFSKAYLSAFASNNAATDSANGCFCFIPHYKGSFYKQVFSVTGGMDYSSTNNPNTSIYTSWWQSTNSIQTIDFSTAVTGANIKSGSVFSVYGIL